MCLHILKDRLFATLPKNGFKEAEIMELLPASTNLKVYEKSLETKPKKEKLI